MEWAKLPSRYSYRCTSWPRLPRCNDASDPTWRRKQIKNGLKAATWWYNLSTQLHTYTANCILHNRGISLKYHLKIESVIVIYQSTANNNYFLFRYMRCSRIWRHFGWIFENSLLPPKDTYFHAITNWTIYSLWLMTCDQIMCKIKENKNIWWWL